MSRNENGVNVVPTEPSSGAEESLQVAYAKAARDTSVADINIDRGAPSW